MSGADKGGNGPGKGGDPSARRRVLGRNRVGSGIELVTDALCRLQKLTIQLP